MGRYREIWGDMPHLAQQRRAHALSAAGQRLLRLAVRDGGLAHHEEDEPLPALVLQVALRAERADQLGQREAHAALGLAACGLKVEHPQLWGGRRRAPEAMVSFQAAQAALWGA